MKLDEDSWLCGFFEGQTSFAVNIGLTKTLNQRYVIFKPYVVIANTDKFQIDFIIDFLQLETKISKKKKESNKKEVFSLNIQNFNDIDKIIAKVTQFDFKSKTKQEKLLKFLDCYSQIKELGHIHKKWDNKFEEIIEKKLDINSSRSNISKNRFNKDDWMKKIKEHFSI